MGLDVVFVGVGALFWVATVLLVRGLRKLQRPQGGRP
jgi:hypothetical protein